MDKMSYFRLIGLERSMKVNPSIIINWIKCRVKKTRHPLKNPVFTYSRIIIYKEACFFSFFFLILIPSSSAIIHKTNYKTNTMFIRKSFVLKQIATFAFIFQSLVQLSNLWYTKNSNVSSCKRDLFTII
jgi:hypothetical protein